MLMLFPSINGATSIFLHLLYLPICPSLIIIIISTRRHYFNYTDPETLSDVE